MIQKHFEIYMVEPHQSKQQRALFGEITLT